MTDVVVRLAHADLERRIARYAELLTGTRLDPGVGSCQLVLAAPGHTFHDFRRAGIEGQGGGQHHADRFFGAIGKSDAVADAFAVKVYVGLGGDGDVGDAGGAHGVAQKGKNETPC